MIEDRLSFVRQNRLKFFYFTCFSYKAVLVYNRSGKKIFCATSFLGNQKMFKTLHRFIALEISLKSYNVSISHFLCSTACLSDASFVCFLLLTFSQRFMNFFLSFLSYAKMEKLSQNYFIIVTESTREPSFTHLRSFTPK